MQFHRSLSACSLPPETAERFAIVAMALKLWYQRSDWPVMTCLMRLKTPKPIISDVT